MSHTQLLVIGAGASGVSAAVSAWDSGCRDILLVDRRDDIGGVLPQCIHEGFGLARYGRELTGPEYTEKLRQMLKATGVKLCLGVSVVSVSPDRTAILSGRDGIFRIGFDRLIIASGCREISVGELMIPGTRPDGIYTAGQAQELINIHRESIGRNILIMGCGDLGMIMARRFSLEGKNVIAVIEKEDHYTGMARNYHRCVERYNIPVMYSSAVTRIHGEGRITGLSVRDARGERFIPCDTLITAVGMVPDTALADRLSSPPWLSLCGNCSRIHSIVDSAVEEAVRVGKEWRIVNEL